MVSHLPSFMKSLSLLVLELWVESDTFKPNGPFPRRHEESQAEPSIQGTFRYSQARSDTVRHFEALAGP